MVGGNVRDELHVTNGTGTMLVYLVHANNGRAKFRLGENKYRRRKGE